MTSRTLSMMGIVALTVGCGGGSGSGSGGAGGGTRASGGSTGGSSARGGGAGTHSTGGAAGAGGDRQSTGGAGGSQASGGATTTTGGSQASGGTGAGGSQASGGATTTTGGSQASGGTRAGGSQASGGAAATTGGSQASGGTRAGGSQASGGATGGAAGSKGGAGGGAAGAGGGTGGAAGAMGGTQGKGGTSGTPSTSDHNVVAVTVDSGPDGINYINGPFATITLCEPGTNNCQTIDHLLIDTGSTGIRVLESVVTLKLPAATSSSGKNLAECLPFMSGSSWGPVKTADVKIGGESASKMRLQLIGETSYPMDSGCSGTPMTDLDTVGSNGILGVGLNIEDCGSSCASKGVSNPGLYYECTSNKAGGCTPVAVPVADQIANPIASFSVDNNGSFLQLPAIPAAGAASVDGSLVFGIGTQANNGLGAAKVIPVDVSGLATTVFPTGGTKYKSFIDSGSNGLYFLDSTTSKIATCTSGVWAGFYCPQSTTNLTASMTSKDGSAAPVSFSVDNASKFSMSNFAFSGLAGPMWDSSGAFSSIGFDWGFPFFYGRTVFTALENHDTPGGAGPYFAY